MRARFSALTSGCLGPKVVFLAGFSRLRRRGHPPLKRGSYILRAHDVAALVRGIVARMGSFRLYEVSPLAHSGKTAHNVADLPFGIDL